MKSINWISAAAELVFPSSSFWILLGQQCGCGMQWVGRWWEAAEPPPDPSITSVEISSQLCKVSPAASLV